MNSKLWIGIIAASLLLIAGLTVWLWQSPTPVATPEVGRPVADAFLAQIAAGQVDAAWESTSAEFKSDEGRDSFRALVAKTPLLRGKLEFASYREVELNTLRRAECEYVPPAPAAATPAKVRVVVGLDGIDWKVDGVFVE
ncbi:MAG: hypothetical protein SFU86_15730 [Pirellulaceae bacterium]|nr:hypothetical protein [Pirellulaceae bacterium]